MLRKLFGILASGSFVPVYAAAADREPEVLQRSGKWEVNYDADSCRLLGQFGEGDNAIVAQFTRYAPGDRFDLSLYGKRLPEHDPNARINVRLTFGPSGPRMQREAWLGNAAKVPMLMFTSLRLDDWKGNPRNSELEESPDITPEQEAAITDATFDVPLRRPFRLIFGSLGKPMEMMRACQTDLVRHWGYDPKVQRSLRRPPTPIGKPASWLRNEDYPRGAVYGRNNGVVQFRLDIDAEGKVANCTTLFRTNPDLFGDATCKAITRRARFEPALGADGKAVRSFFVSKVHWQFSR